jgi:hypothetical protein
MNDHGESKRFATAIMLHSDNDAARPGTIARWIAEAMPACRLLALAAIHVEATRAESARIGHVMPQSVGEWVVTYSTAGANGLVSLKAPGQAKHQSIHALSSWDHLLEYVWNALIDQPSRIMPIGLRD